MRLKFMMILQVLKHPLPNKRRRSRTQPPPTFVAEPATQSNSFVGTEEYIAPVQFTLSMLDVQLSSFLFLL